MQELPVLAENRAGRLNDSKREHIVRRGISILPRGAISVINEDPREKHQLLCMLQGQ